MTGPLRSTDLSDDACARVRTELMLDHAKWDPQFGDVAKLARFVLVIERAAWSQLAATSERLAAELEAVEADLATRSELGSSIGVPKPLRRLYRARTPSRGSPRVLRFDFHWTASGFVLSEVNADVPGGVRRSLGLPCARRRVRRGRLARGRPHRRFGRIDRTEREGRLRRAALCAGPSRRRARRSWPRCATAGRRPPNTCEPRVRLRAHPRHRCGLPRLSSRMARSARGFRRLRLAPDRE